MKSYGVLFTLSAMLMAMLAPAVIAGGCPVSFRSSYYAPTYSAPVYSAPVYQERIVEKVNYYNVARIVEIPLYSTYNAVAIAPYAVAPALAAPAQAKSECTEALASFKAMQAELAQLKQQLAKPQAPPYHPPTMPPAVEPKPEPIDPFSPQASKGGNARERVASVIATRCTSCHDDKNAKLKGEGVELVAGGKVKDLSPMLGDIIKYVSSKGCPKKGSAPMSTDERLEFIADLTALASAK